MCIYGAQVREKIRCHIGHKYSSRLNKFCKPNGVEPDQSDQGLHHLLFHGCSLYSHLSSVLQIKMHNYPKYHLISITKSILKILYQIMCAFSQMKDTKPIRLIFILSPGSCP